MIKVILHGKLSKTSAAPRNLIANAWRKQLREGFGDTGIRHYLKAVSHSHSGVKGVYARLDAAAAHQLVRKNNGNPVEPLVVARGLKDDWKLIAKKNEQPL